MTFHVRVVGGRFCVVEGAEDCWSRFAVIGLLLWLKFSW